MKYHSFATIILKILNERDDNYYDYTYQYYVAGFFSSTYDNYYDRNMIRKMWDRHQSGKSDYSWVLWSVIVFNMWFKKWMK